MQADIMEELNEAEFKEKIAQCLEVRADRLKHKQLSEN